MPMYIDITNKKLGRWTVLSREKDKIYPSGGRCPQYLCRCDCGNEKIIPSKSLRDGSSKSCGCLNSEIRKETCIKRNTTHGYAAKGKSLTYSTWQNMIARCHNENSSGYYKYGARGIKVCDRWRKFENFLEDMGEKENKDMSIERINPFLGYSKDNCKWIPLSDQQKNKTNSAIKSKQDLLRIIDLYLESTDPENRDFIMEKIRDIPGFNQVTHT